MYDKQLLTFLQVVESGSFAKAGEKLYLSPVSVMKQINNLERHMNIKLLKRTNHGVVPTPSGQLIYQTAQEMMKRFNDTVQKAQALSATEKNTIRIGSSTLRPCKLMMEKWAEIDDGNLPFQIEIVPFSDKITDMNKALELLGKDFDCFVTIWDEVLWESSYSTLFLSTRPYHIAMSRKHPLASKQSLTWSDLEGESLLLLKQGLSSHVDLIRKEIESNHPAINILDAPRYYSTEIFNQCAQQNFLMGALDIWNEIHPSIITLPMDWNYSFNYGIIYKKTPSAAMRLFIDTINRHHS